MTDRWYGFTVKFRQFPWALDVTKNAVEDGFRRLGNSLNSYFSSKAGKRKGEKMGFPNFKSKKRAKQTFALDYERFKVDGHWLSIQKLPTPINMAETLRMKGKPKWAHISCRTGKWYASIVVEIAESVHPLPPQEAVGVGPEDAGNVE
jgi:putative transposase